MLLLLRLGLALLLLIALVADGGRNGEVGGGGGWEPVGKVSGIHRAVEIEWEGTDGDEFLLQKSDDLENWETVETVVGTGDATSTFLRVEGRVQFWRLHRE